jgi:hypothetical protein
MKLTKNMCLAILFISVIGGNAALAQSLKSKACTPFGKPDYEVATFEEMQNTPFAGTAFVLDGMSEGETVVVNCSAPSLDTGFRYAVEDLETIFSLQYDEYVAKLLGYRTDSFTFLSYNQPRLGGVTFEILSAVGTRDLKSIFNIPVNKRSVGANGAIGYATALFGKPGDEIPFSGKKYNYEVHYSGHGQIELYYQSKNGGAVHTADCRNEGYAGAVRLSENMARDGRDFIDEWNTQQCASYCSNNKEHRKKCKKIISHSYQKEFIYNEVPWK